MSSKYEQLKAAFGKRSQGGNSNENNGFWDKFYPFYKMDFNEVAIFRFLPDADENNPLQFVVDNIYHELEINGKKKRLACLKMHDGEDAYCPCCAKSQYYYNEMGDEAMGKKFWKKTDWIASGIVVHSPFEYPIKPDENPVRMISLGPKLFKKIEGAVLSGDFDVEPFDPLNGYDFRINKTKQSEWADYTNSEFARKSTPIAEDVLNRIKMYDLKNFRYARVAPEQMETMIEAFLTGRSYDDKPDEGQGGSAPEQKPAASASEVISAVKEAPSEAPPASAAPAASSSRAQEILARLHARNKTA